MNKKLVLLFVFTTILYQLHGQIPNQQHYICTRTIGQLSIDGKLDEESWQKATWTEKFVDIEGDLKPKPLYETRAKMLWDDDYFYIAAKIYEPHIWATLTERDAVIFQDNDFEVFIDPDGDTHKYYEFEINALGTIWDLMLGKPYRDGGPVINAWDIRGLKKGIQIEGTLNDPSDEDDFWTVELAFPWKVLKEAARRTPKGGDQWKVNFSRVNWRVDAGATYSKAKDPATGKRYPEFNWVWSPQGAINMHMPENWGIVQFSMKDAGTTNIEYQTPDGEPIKYLLRKVYYAQRKFYRTNKRYATDLKELDIPDIDTDQAKKISLGATFSQFEAIHVSDNGDTWHIIQDGKVWRTNRK
ncbi:MAG: carbohydrate-binding family 9-like protein [Cyclobacteriaceae bacterium]